MGRQAYRMSKRFSWSGVWWGYLLDPIICKCCDGAGEGCPTCEGNGKCYPKINPPGYKVDDLPVWWAEWRCGEDYGWQMWEDVSEGSPISPIFDTPEELARWLADNNASACGNRTANYEQWLKTILCGWAVSMVMQGGVMQSGVEGFNQGE